MRGGLPAWELGMNLTTAQDKMPICYEMLHRAQNLSSSSEHCNEFEVLRKTGNFLTC